MTASANRFPPLRKWATRTVPSRDPVAIRIAGILGVDMTHDKLPPALRARSRHAADRFLEDVMTAMGEIDTNPDHSTSSYLDRDPQELVDLAREAQLEVAHVDEAGEGYWHLGNLIRYRQDRRDGRANPAGLDNPAWVTGTLSRAFETMEAKIPPAWLPKLDKIKPVNNKLTGRLKEYGCGAYGCVLPTLDPKIVLKITTDQTEAEFAAKLAPKLVVPVTTHYRMVMELPERHRGGKIFLLWREEAKDVGEIKKVSKKPSEARRLISEQHQFAQAAYELIYDGERGRPLKDALASWMEACAAMGTLAELGYLSEGMLRVYTEQHIFFGDIHEGNIGRAQRDGKLEWVITDPGHVAVVK